MSDLQTNVSVKVVNQASEPLHNIGSDMQQFADAIKKANVDLAGFSDKLQGVGKGANAASEGGLKLKGVMGGLMSEISPFTIGAAGIAAALVAIGKASLEAANQVEVVGSRAKSVFGSDFASAEASADRLSAALKRDKEDILNMETSFAAMTRGAGIAAKESMIVAEGMTELSVAFAKLNHLSDDDAFEKMKQGLSGMGRGLKEYGIYLDDATLSEFAHKEGIKAKYEELNEGGQQLVRYMYIQQHLIEQEANAGQTTMSLREAWIEFKTAIDPVLEVLGALILIPIKEFLLSMADGITTAINLLKLLAAAAQDTAADIYNMGVSVAQFFGLADEATKMSTDHVTHQFQEMSKASSENLTPMSKDIQQVTKDNKDFVDIINKGGFKAFGAGASGAADEAKKLKKAMEDLGKGFDDTFGDIASKTKDLEMRHKEAVDGIISKNKDLYDRLNDLRTAASNTAAAFADIGIKFKEAMADINSDREDKVVSQYEKIKQMTEDLKRAQGQPDALSNDQLVNIIQNMKDPKADKISYEEARGFNLSDSSEQMVNLTLQLHKEQQALKDYLSENLNLSEQLKNSISVGSTDFVKNAADLVKQSAGGGVARSQMSSFTLEMQELKKKAGQTQSQYDKDSEQNQKDIEENQKQQQKVKDDIAALDKKRKAVEYAYQQERAEIGYTKVALDAFHSQYLTQMEDMSKVTDQTVANVKKQLELLRQVLQQAQQDAAYAAQQTSAASARGAARTKFADGGVVGSRAGGMDVTVAEGLYNEAIVPLPDGRSIPVRIEGGMNGGGNSITITIQNMNVEKTADADEVIRYIGREVQKQLTKSY